MEVDFEKRRAIFLPYTAETDKDPITKKIGVRTHFKIIGFILSFFGKAQKLHDNKHNKDFYVDTDDAIRFLGRHGIKKIHWDPGFFGPNYFLELAIDNAISMAKLTSQLKENPSNAATFYERGRIFAEGGNPKQAIDDFTSAIQLNPNDKQKARYINHRAYCCEQEGSIQSLKQALQDYTEMHNIDPKMPSQIDSTDWIPPIQRRADVYEKLKQFDLALQDYHEVLKADPNDAWIWFHCGLLHEQKKDFDSAIQAFEKALKIHPHRNIFQKELNQVRMMKKGNL